MNKYKELFEEILEDGYSRIPHIALESLAAAKINGTQRAICAYLMRSSYGWGKIAEAVSLNELARGCQKERSLIRKNLNDLLEKKIVIRLDYHPESKTSILMYNHNILQWEEGCIDLDKFFEQKLHSRKI